MLGWVLAANRSRQHQQGQAAQRVVDAEQHPGVEPVGEPAGEDRADDVEDPDQREQVGRCRRRHAVVVRGRDEVRADQPVGGRAADREAAGEQPERRGTGGVAQRGQRPAGRAGPGGAGSAGARRVGAVRRSARRRAGWSRSSHSASGATSSAAPATASAAAAPAVRAGQVGQHRQEARAGPAAPPAVSTPVTIPRCLTNQRLVTVATKASAIEPVPRPTSTPQHSTSCQLAVMNTVSPLPAATSTSAAATTRRMPNRSISAAANGEVRPNSTRLTETAAEMVPARPAELLLQRGDQHARGWPGSRPRRRWRRTPRPRRTRHGGSSWRGAPECREWSRDHGRRPPTRRRVA